MLRRERHPPRNDGKTCDLLKLDDSLVASRVDNGVGLPNGFTAEYTENTEKTYYILRELSVLPRHPPSGLGCRGRRNKAHSFSHSLILLHLAIQGYPLEY